MYVSHICIYAYYGYVTIPGILSFFFFFAHVFTYSASTEMIMQLISYIITVNGTVEKEVLHE